MTSINSRDRPLAEGRHIRSRWSVERTERNLSAVRERIRRRNRIATSCGIGFTAAALFAMAGLAGSRFASGRQLSSAPSASVQENQIVHFVDGSFVQLLDVTSRLDVAAVSDNTVDVVLRAGTGHFEVTPNPSRRFVVHAGSVDIVVLGTSFHVAREEARVRVAVHHGRVEVHGAGHGIRVLSNGEASWFPSEGIGKGSPMGAGTVDRLSGQEQPPADPMPEPNLFDGPVSPAEASSNGLRAPHSTSVSAHAARGDLRAERKRFVEHANRKEYAEAFAMIERTPELVGNTATELMLAADAARLSNHPAQAASYLERVTRDYSRDSRAPMAAFTLGRICMSQTGEIVRAAEAFAMARRLSPSGPLAEDALAREVEARERLGQRNHARTLADEYIRRYPMGRRLRSVQIHRGQE